MTAPLVDFNYWITAAREDLQRRRNFRSTTAQADYLRLATTSLSRALSAANRLRDARRRSLCMRALNWVRTDLNQITRSAA
ncbi:MAG: hypothetical protein J0I42_14840 [Bosea sp.]|uniref:hypothetical protein n=1 Tax=Bosea sp. (in: a-proteobacteria) TaxID=1871050 RepID=UPI001AC2C7C9|nr:hypothetical protein [Bosea sp. (in: a-proteobacteria)]MBN9453222.1 hypothetical protein [Bosea sp. (in: a-proteobacteria)]